MPACLSSSFACSTSKSFDRLIATCLNWCCFSAMNEASFYSCWILLCSWARSFSRACSSCNWLDSCNATDLNFMLACLSFSFACSASKSLVRSTASCLNDNCFSRSFYFSFSSSASFCYSRRRAWSWAICFAYSWCSYSILIRFCLVSSNACSSRNCCDSFS